MGAVVEVNETAVQPLGAVDGAASGMGSSPTAPISPSLKRGIGQDRTKTFDPESLL
jgi:hypothetical protein